MREITPHGSKKLDELAAFLIELAERFKAQEEAEEKATKNESGSKVI